MNALRTISQKPITLIVLAVLLLMLAAITVQMVERALGHSEHRVAGTVKHSMRTAGD